MASAYKALSKGTPSTKSEAPPNGVKKNKQRVLILSSRGVTHRHRHLLTDLATLLPHSRRESKFDSKSKLFQLCELGMCVRTGWLVSRRLVDVADAPEQQRTFTTAITCCFSRRENRKIYTFGYHPCPMDPVSNSTGTSLYATATVHPY